MRSVLFLSLLTDWMKYGGILCTYITTIEKEKFGQEYVKIYT